MGNKAHYNIMTSCDDNLVPYVEVQLVAMAQNMKEAAVDFYFFHSRVSRKNI
jgi:lipopolysaccharide biosynthesis glycosyltransferase